MGGGKGRKYRKRNLVQDKKKLTPDRKVSEPDLKPSTAGRKVSEPDLKPSTADRKVSEPEKRIFYLSSINGEEHHEFLHELPVQEIDDENNSLREDLLIPAKDLRIITAEPTTDRLKYYCRINAAAVGLGSRIYRIGGRCFYRIGDRGFYGDGGSLGEEYGCTPGCNGGSHAGVFYVEVDGQPNKEWKQCRSMNRGRKAPLACAVDGKIYVFGGAADGKFGGEVYDPIKDKWTELPSLDDFMGYHLVSPMNVVLDDLEEASNKLILVHIQGTKPLYAFNVRKNVWELFDDKFGWVGPDKGLPSLLRGCGQLMLWWIIFSTVTLLGDFLHTIWMRGSGSAFMAYLNLLNFIILFIAAIKCCSIWEVTPYAFSGLIPSVVVNSRVLILDAQNSKELGLEEIKGNQAYL
ncbi:Galactose oxidase, beta-propeller [Corchorus olitorius]|uniref:Galactose oxidase, beta-propeller n=1 Tax=Corchorus olitorius TaxID=93759 RepID=A0A1R3H6W3_9ROSI|nr:Galactose oxidase, beta-propeller [Corchorus olitorius]